MSNNSGYHSTTSNIRNVIGTPSRPQSNQPMRTPSYNSSRLYTKNKKGRNPKRFSFEVTLYNNPGERILKKTLIDHKDLKEIGSGSIVLFDNQNDRDVNDEIRKLCTVISGLADETFTNMNFLFLKREGRKRQFRRHHCSSSFVYDSVGLKDLTTKDSKCLHIVLSESIPSSSNTERRVTNTLAYDSDSDIFEVNPFQLSSTSSRKSSCTVTRPSVQLPSSVRYEEDPAADVFVLIKDMIKDSSISNKPAYFMSSGNECLVAVLALLRHVEEFNSVLNFVIDNKGETASEIEHTLAQVMMLFEDSSSAAWKIGLEELNSELEVSADDSCHDVYLKLMAKLKNLKCVSWNELFFTPLFSSNLTSEYYSDNGIAHVERNDSSSFVLEMSHGNDDINTLMLALTSRAEVQNVPAEVSHIMIEDGCVWRRRYFQKLPELLCCGISWKDCDVEHPLEVNLRMRKDLLEDVRSTNKESYSAFGFITAFQQNVIVAIKCLADSLWKFYVDGKVFVVKMNDMMWRKLNGKSDEFHIVVAVYSSIVLHLEEEPDVTELKTKGQFLINRLKSKCHVQDDNIDVMVITDTPQSEFEVLNLKLQNRLRAIHGQNELKTRISVWARHVLMEKQKLALGATSQSKAETVADLHMILSGNPGTGKTMVARCMAGILFDIGLLLDEQIEEVQRNDLVSCYIGDTSKKTEECVRKAFGRVMFVDEAYTLVSKAEKDYGKEAVETIMRFMLPSKNEDQYPVFIFAGYESNMNEFVGLNRGLRRRIKHVFHFSDYSPIELSEIVKTKLLQKKIRIPYGIEKIITECFMKIPMSVRSELNASLCDDLISEVRCCQESRLSFEATFNELIKYTEDDFVKGITALLESKRKRSDVNFKDASTQTPMEVTLHIPGVGPVPCSPVT